MSWNGMAILFREADCHTRPTVSWGLNRDSAALVPFTLMLYVFSTYVKAFVVDSRFVFKSHLKQTVHIMAFALLFCAITLPIQCTTHWSPFQGCVQCTCIILAEIALYSTSHFKLSSFFILYPFCHCTLAFRWLFFVQVLLSTAISFHSSDNNAWQLKKKLPSLL